MPITCYRRGPHCTFEEFLNFFRDRIPEFREYKRQQTVTFHDFGTATVTSDDVEYRVLSDDNFRNLEDVQVYRVLDKRPLWPFAPAEVLDYVEIKK